MSGTGYNISNYDDIFLRDSVLGVVSQFYNKLRWVNRWDNKEKLITIPFYYGMAGDERFMFDSFIDDIISSRPDLSYNPVPRGHVYMDIGGIQMKRNEYSNPYVNLQFEEISSKGLITKKTGKFKNIPLEIPFQVKIKLSSEGDMMKCFQTLMDWEWPYTDFYIKYKGMRIDAVMMLPDNLQSQIPRDYDTITSKNTDKFLEFNVSVYINYPSPFKENKAKNTVCGTKNIYKGKIFTLEGMKGDQRWIGDDSYREYKRKK